MKRRKSSAVSSLSAFDRISPRKAGPAYLEKIVRLLNHTANRFGMQRFSCLFVA
jgi:hypothetical protein